MLSHSDIRKGLGALLRTQLGEGWWVLDVWDAYAVLEDPNGVLYRQDYTVSATDQLSLSGGMHLVRRVTEYVPLAEAVGPLREAIGTDGAAWSVLLIQPGLSYNGVMYPADVLRASAGLFEGVRALARSDKAHRQDEEVDARNVVGWYDNAHYDEAAGVVATFHITEDAAWLRQKLLSAWNAGKKDLLGFSLVAAGQGRRVAHEQTTVLWVDKLDSVHYVDVVVNPAAGGKLLQLIAGLPAARALRHFESEERMRAQLLARLKEARPTLYSLIDPATITDEDLTALVAAELVEATPPAPTGPPAPTAAPAPSPAPSSDPMATVHAAEAIVQAAAQRVQLLECRATLREALASSALPEPARVRLRNRFTRQLDTGKAFATTELTEAIDDTRLLLAGLEESGKVQGLGSTGGRVQLTEDQQDKSVQSLLDFFDGKVLSFREAIRGIPGSDRLIRDGNLRRAVPWTNWPALAEAKGIVLRESLDSTSFDQILADVMHKRLVQEYRRPELNTWRHIVQIGSVSDFQTQHRTRFGGYGNLPAVAQGAPYTSLTSPSDEEATYTPAKYGGTEDITWEMIRNDDANVIRFIPIRLGRAAAQTLHEFVFDFLKDNPTIYDAVALFHANHNNLNTTALGTTDAEFLVHRLAMRQQTEAGSSKRLGLTPSFLVLPGDLEADAYTIFVRSTNLDARFSQTVAPTIISVDYWTDANNWYTVCNPSDCPTIEVAFLDGQEEPEIFVQDDETVGTMFTSDKRTLKVRHVYGGAVMDYRGMQGAVVA